MFKKRISMLFSSIFIGGALFFTSSQVEATKVVTLNCPEVNIHYTVNIPDEVIEERDLLKLRKKNLSTVELGKLTLKDQILMDDTPVRTAWLDSLTENPKEFLKGYFAMYDMDACTRKDTIESLKEALYLESEGKPLVFYRFSCDEVIQRWRKHWIEPGEELYDAEGDGDYEDVIETTTGWLFDGRYWGILKKATPDLVINFPISQISD